MIVVGAIPENEYIDTIRQILVDNSLDVDSIKNPKIKEALKNSETEYLKTINEKLSAALTEDEQAWLSDKWFKNEIDTNDLKIFD